MSSMFFCKMSDFSFPCRHHITILNEKLIYKEDIIVVTE